MGYKSKQFFLMATMFVACVFSMRAISASPVPARRAFDTSPAGVNNVAGLSPNGVQDVDATIKEVEGLLNADPSLPRLTRGEILDIIENLTQAEGQKGVARDPKAIMVVLPYSADNVQNGDFQSLFTKPPMTHIIEDGSEDERTTVKSEVPQKKRRPTKKPYQQVGVEQERVKVAKVPTTEAPREDLFEQNEFHHEFEQQQRTTQKSRTTTENPFTRFKVSTTEAPREDLFEQNEFHHEFEKQQRTTQKSRTTSQNPFTRFKVPTTEAPREDLFDQNEFHHESEQQQRTPTQKSRTTTENPFTRFINRGRKTTKLPSNHKQEFQDFPEISTTSRTTTTTTEEPKTTRKRKATRRPTSTTSTTTLKPFEFIPNHGINIVSPPSFQPMPATSTSTLVEFQPIPTRPTTTTTTTTTPRPRPKATTPRYISSSTTTPTTTSTTTTTTTTRPMMVDEVQIPEDFKEVLKSLDILIKNSPKQPPSLYDTPLEQQEQLTEEDKLKQLFASLGVQTSTTSTSTTTPEPDVMQVANNLTPEMKDLLMTFGLIPDPNKDKTTTPKEEIFMEPSSVISADSYSSFKPLPVQSAANASPSEDMEDFLAKFGLVDKNQPGSPGIPGSNRGQKAISMSKPQNDLQPNLDMIPDGFKDVIADIVLPVKIEPKPQSDSQLKQLELPSLKKPDHVFNPATSGTEYATEDEINRLNQLMGVIKQFEKLNGTASEDDLKHIDLEGLKDLVNSFNVPLDQQKGPNPLDYDVGLLKNEVKRQTSTTEKPVEIINPSLALLEDSFGGSSDTVSEPAAVETTTTEAPKKTGFYYLLDWNSFFDIDNQKGKRVNLRFQPKVGDPKRFFSVTVP